MFILGAIFGSFLLVIGSRMPLKENVFTTDSTNSVKVLIEHGANMIRLGRILFGERN